MEAMKTGVEAHDAATDDDPAVGSVDGGEGDVTGYTGLSTCHQLYHCNNNTLGEFSNHSKPCVVVAERSRATMNNNTLFTPCLRLLNSPIMQYIQCG